MYKVDKTPEEIADIIEAFVYRKPMPEQVRHDLEWNDLLDCGVRDPILNSIVKQCELINRDYIPEPGDSEVSKFHREQEADRRLKSIVAQLREMGRRERT